MSPTCRKIVDGLKTHGINCPDDVAIQRTRAGHWQRSAGAWSWFLASPSAWGYNLRIGSQHPASLVAKGFTIYEHLYTLTLDPIKDRVTRKQPARYVRKMSNQYVVQFELLCGLCDSDAKSPECAFSTEPALSKREAIQDAKNDGWEKMNKVWYCKSCCNMIKERNGHVKNS